MMGGGKKGMRRRLKRKKGIGKMEFKGVKSEKKRRDELRPNRRAGTKKDKQEDGGMESGGVSARFTARSPSLLGRASLPPWVKTIRPK